MKESTTLERLDIKDGRKVDLGPKSMGHSVIVEGRCIPKLKAIERGDEIEFILDDRFSYSIPVKLSSLFAAAMAQSMAIGGGYSSLNDEGAPLSFAPTVACIELPPTT